MYLAHGQPQFNLYHHIWFPKHCPMCPYKNNSVTASTSMTSESCSDKMGIEASDYSEIQIKILDFWFTLQVRGSFCGTKCLVWEIGHFR